MNTGRDFLEKRGFKKRATISFGQYMNKNVLWRSVRNNDWYKEGNWIVLIAASGNTRAKIPFRNSKATKF